MSESPKVIVAMHVQMVGAVLCWVLALATSAVAEGAWVLWGRTCDVRSEVCGGAWQRGQAYEAERWCRAARIVAVNQALTSKGSKAAKARGAVVEYQCLPDTLDPRGPEGNK